MSMAVGTYLVQRSARLNRAIEVYNIVIANIGVTFVEVPAANVGSLDVLALARGGAVDDNIIVESHNQVNLGSILRTATERTTF